MKESVINGRNDVTIFTFVESENELCYNVRNTFEKGRFI